MKVQATKTMTKAINDFLKENGEQMRAIYETMSRRAFEINVDFDLWENESDYLPASDKMRADKIVYPRGILRDAALPDKRRTCETFQEIR